MSKGLGSTKPLTYLALAALTAAILQVALGGVVRVTGSGLGCPDWPLCDGRVIPVFERAPLVEFSHRAVASIVGLLTLAVAVLAVRRYRGEVWIEWPSLAAVFLVLAASLLGAVVVWTELAWWVRLAHLAMAEGVVACMVVVTLAAWRSGAPDGAPPSGGWTGALMLGSVASTFLVILWGSYMVGYGAGFSCGTWPLCRGSLLPEGAVYAINMGHRFSSAAAGAILLGAAVMALRRGAGVPGLGLAAWAALAALLGQMLLGAWTVWAGFTMEIRAAHLAGATLLWAAAVALATTYRAPRIQPRVEAAP